MKYQILGDTLPVVVCELENGEKMITEGGGMSWMSPNMKMETTTNGGIGKAFGRMFSGEKIFQNIYTAQGNGMIAFASSFPGSIKAFDIAPGQEMIFQKSAFLAGESGVEMSVFFNKKLGAGLFGGEGFIMQRYQRLWNRLCRIRRPCGRIRTPARTANRCRHRSSGSHDCHLFHRHSGRSRGKKYALWR